MHSTLDRDELDDSIQTHATTFGDYTIREAKDHMAAAGIPMRIP